MLWPPVHRVFNHDEPRPRVIARLDQAIALFIVSMRMGRLGRVMTLDVSNGGCFKRGMFQTGRKLLRSRDLRAVDVMAGASTVQLNVLIRGVARDFEFVQ